MLPASNKADSDTINRAVVIGSALIFALCLIFLWLLPRGAFVLVVATPFSGERAVLSVIQSANGRFVSGGSLPWLAVAYSDEPAFPTRLRQAGAFLVLNADLISICSQETYR